MEEARRATISSHSGPLGGDPVKGALILFELLSRFKLRAAVGLLVLILALGTFLAIHAEVIRIYLVVSESMEPTLRMGDRVLIDSHGAPELFSIVSFQDPTRRHDPEEQLIKRVIAMGGDTVEIFDGLLFVNGVLQSSNQVSSNLVQWHDVRIVVPYDHFFVLGDNRNRSFDSLDFGPVENRNITGVMRMIIWPPRRWGRLPDFLDVDASESERPA
jgi:signal peptidase I